MSLPDEVREFAFERLFVPRVEDDGSGSVESLLALMTPEQRQQAHAIASRRLAMQMLYEIDQTEGAGAIERVLELLDRTPELGPIQRERIEALVRGAWQDRREADAQLLDLAPGWPSTRQPAVDRAILRLARFELTSGLNPAAIVINEAVELAKRFSTEKSPGFINGVLGKMATAFGATTTGEG